jgi:hypothetical protein
MKLMERALSKLAINAYLDREMKKPAGGIEAMYNPSSIDLSYEIDYIQNEAINEPDVTSEFSAARPGTLSLELIFDANLPGNKKSVDEQLTRLRAICCSIDEATKEPRFLQVKWGKMRWNGNGYFGGRMTSLAVRYTLFDRDASPLRAVATLTLKADESLVLQKSIRGGSAPKTVVVRAPSKGPLPLIAATVGAGVGAIGLDYLALAASNGLDNLNDFAPGKRLLVLATGGV